MITITLPLSWALDQGKIGALYIVKAAGKYDAYGVGIAIFYNQNRPHEDIELAVEKDGRTEWSCPIQVCNGPVSSVSVAHNMPESNRWHAILNVPTIVDRIILRAEQEIGKFLPVPDADESATDERLNAPQTSQPHNWVENDFNR